MMRWILYILVFLACSPMKAQAPSKFIATYGGDGVDIGYSIKELRNREYIVVGATSSFDAQGTDVILMKLDSMGHALWIKKFGGVGLEVGKAIVINPTDSSYYIAGYSNSNINSGYDVYCLHVDKNGNLIWENKVGGTDWDFASDLKIASDGNLLIVGKTNSQSIGKEDGLILKLNSSSGALMWSKNYGTVEEDDFNSIVIDATGTVFVSGNTVRTNNDPQFWLVALNQNGDTSYTKTFGHIGRKDICYDMMLDKQQNLVLCGSFDTSAYGTGKNVGYIEKVNAQTLSSIQFTLGGAGPNDRFLSVANRFGNNDYCFSRSVLYGAQQTNVQPILFIDNFTYLQSTTYGGFEFDEAYEIIPTSDKGYAMIGYSKSYNNGKDQDIYFVKLDSTFLSASILVGLGQENQEIVSKSYYSNHTIFNTSISGKNPQKFRIFDTSGQLALQSIIENGSYKLNDAFKPGVYVVVFENGDKLKIIVQ